MKIEKTSDNVYTVTRDGFFLAFIHKSQKVIALEGFLGLTLEELEEVVKFMRELK